MALKGKIEKIESRLKAAGRQVSDLCEEAGIARSTWTRWKYEKVSPNMTTWLDVERAVNALCQEDAA